MRVLALSAFALAVNVDQVDSNLVETMDFEAPMEEGLMIEEMMDEDNEEEENAQLEFFRGSEEVDEQELAQLVDDVPNVEKELVQMEDDLAQLQQEIDDELPEICAQLGIENQWGFFSRAARWAKEKARRAAEAARRAARAAAARAAAIARAAAAKARAALNWAKNKAASLANQFRNYIRKVDVMKKVKYVVDKFFQVTESKPFKTFFFKVVGRIARTYGFSQANVRAAYKLLTRKFWNNQIWFWKWVFTGGFIQSAKSSSGSRDFARAQGACTDFVGTVDLGATIMMKLKAWPQVVAAGGSIKAGAKIAKPICRVFGLMAKWKKVYNGVKYALSKVGVRLPL